MLIKKYINIDGISKIDSKLSNNTIIIIESIEELNKIIDLAKNNNLNIKSIQTNSDIINNIHKDILSDFKKTFKYISITYTDKLTHKLSNQNNFVEIILDYSYFIENKTETIKNSANRVILDFKDIESKYSKEEITDSINELLSNKIYPLTKNLELNRAEPEHMYEIFNKTITEAEINNSNLSNETKTEIIKFLEDDKNERIINRI